MNPCTTARSSCALRSSSCMAPLSCADDPSSQRSSPGGRVLSGAGDPPPPVGAGLHHVAARLHRAPAAGAVLGTVVEGPPAGGVCAGLQGGAGGRDPWGVRRGQQPPPRPLDAAVLGLQPRPPARGE